MPDMTPGSEPFGIASSIGADREAEWLALVAALEAQAKAD